MKVLNSKPIENEHLTTIADLLLVLEDCNRILETVQDLSSDDIKLIRMSFRHERETLFNELQQIIFIENVLSTAWCNAYKNEKGR